MYNMIAKVIALVMCIASLASSQHILARTSREATGYPLVQHTRKTFTSPASPSFGSPIYETSITPCVQQPHNALHGLVFDGISRCRSPELFTHWNRINFPPNRGFDFGSVTHGIPDNAYCYRSRSFGMNFNVPLAHPRCGISLESTPMAYSYAFTDHPRYSRGLSFPSFQQSVFYPVKFPVGSPTSSYYQAHPYGRNLLRTIPYRVITPSVLLFKDNSWEHSHSYRNRFNSYENNQGHPKFDSKTSSTENVGRDHYPVVMTYSGLENDRISDNSLSISIPTVQPTDKSNSVSKLILSPKSTLNNHTLSETFDTLRFQFGREPSHSINSYRLNIEDQHYQNEKMISPPVKGSENSATSRDIVSKRYHSLPGYNSTQDTFPTRYNLLQAFEREPSHLSRAEHLEYHNSGEEHLEDSHRTPFVDNRAHSTTSSSSSPFSLLLSFVSSPSRKRHKHQ